LILSDLICVCLSDPQQRIEAEAQQLREQIEQTKADTVATRAEALRIKTAQPKLTEAEREALRLEEVSMMVLRDRFTTRMIVA